MTIVELTQLGACAKSITYLESKPDWASAVNECDNVDWLEWLLRKHEPLWAEYQKVQDTVYVEYRKVITTASAEYDKVVDPAYTEFNKAIAPAWAEYEKVEALAYAKY